MNGKIKGIVGVILIGLLLVGLVWPRLPFNKMETKQVTQQQFKSHWIAELQQHLSLQDVKAISTQGQVGYLNTRTFSDGSWVAVAWHNMHDEGNEWDGSVLWDSNGKLYWSDHHFCGQGIFRSEFLDIPANSLNQFYKVGKFKLSPILIANKQPN